MLRIRFHGRGGQGMKTASRIVGAAAFHPPYIATVSPRHPVDLARKFEKARQFKDLKLFLACAPCPTGWLYDPSQSQQHAKLAVECGLFLLKEAVDRYWATASADTKH